MLALAEAKSRLMDGRVAAAWVPAGRGVGTPFDRPEDVEIVGTTLFVSVTGEDRVLSIDTASEAAPTVGVYVSRERHDGSFDRPDNLARDPDGDLYIAEDISQLDLARGERNRIWYAITAEDPLAPARSLSLFGTVESGNDEPTGLLVDRAGRTLYVNLMGRTDAILEVPLPR